MLATEGLLPHAPGSLISVVDGGADTCVLGAGWYVEAPTLRSANLVGFDAEHARKNNLPIVSALTTLLCGSDTYLVRVHEGVLNDGGITLLSSFQIREHGLSVEDRAGRHGGAPHLQLATDLYYPLTIRGGLATFTHRLPTPEELDTLTPFDLTTDDTWEPRAFDDAPTGAPTPSCFDHAEFLRRVGDRYAQRLSLDAFPFSFDDEATVRHVNTASLVLPSRVPLDSGEPSTSPDICRFALFLSGYCDTDLPSDGPELPYGDRPLAPDGFLAHAWHVDPTLDSLAMLSRVQFSALDVADLVPKLGFRPLDVIRRTLENTTILAKTTLHQPFRRYWKSRYPQLNLRRVREVVATDTLFSSVKAIGGATCAQLFVGLKTQYMRVYGMMSESEGPRALGDYVRDEGAPDRLRRDNSKMQMSFAWQEIQRRYVIGDEWTMPRRPNQNPAEPAIGTLKDQLATLLDRSGAPDDCWLLALQLLAYTWNRCSHPLLHHLTPYAARHGDTPDISALLPFEFYEEVFYLDEDARFPSSNEKSGFWVGVSENVGDAMTWRVLTRDTREIINRSNVRSARDPSRPNRRLSAPTAVPVTGFSPSDSGEGLTSPRGTLVPAVSSVMFKLHSDGDSNGKDQPVIEGARKQRKRVVTFDPANLFKPTVAQDKCNGTTRLANNRKAHSQAWLRRHEAGNKVHTQPEPDDQASETSEALSDPITVTTSPPLYEDSNLIGTSHVVDYRGVEHKGTVVDVVTDPSGERFVKLKMSTNGALHQINYSAFIDALNREEDRLDGFYTFSKILAHRPIADKRHQFEVQVLWDTGEKTWEPLSQVRRDDPLTVAQYAAENRLQGLDGWKWSRSYTKNPKKFVRLARAFKATVQKAAKKYKFGVEVPKSWKDAIRLDEENGNTLWQEALETEVKQLKEYETFKVLKSRSEVPADYKKVPSLIVWDVKFDLRRKARICLGGHRTDPPKEDVYSGVIGLDTVRLLFSLTALNDLQICAADVGNAFLHGTTREKVWVEAGPEFGPDIQGLPLLVVKAWYGLKSSAARFHEAFAESLLGLGFVPSKADGDLWLRRKGDHYEYIATYIDDLLVASRDPRSIIDILQKMYTLKGVGEPEYYLGGNVEDLTETWKKDPGITMGLSARSYIERIVGEIERMAGKQALRTSYKSPLPADYHPECDDSPLVSPERASKYRSMIGALNWIVAIGRFDVAFATSLMARYNMLPREDHFQQVLRIFGYLKRFSKGKIVLDPSYRDTSEFPTPEYDAHSWRQFYPDAVEELPPNMPEPLGKAARITAYFDADHAADVVTRRSVSGILIFVNNTPVRWLSKRQPTVESSTHGSELNAARLCGDLVLGLRYDLRALGVPVDGPAKILGDNKAVIINTTIPSSTLKKKHNSIAYHRVREGVAARAFDLVHIPTQLNPSDALTKPLCPQLFMSLIKPILFRQPTWYEGCEQAEMGLPDEVSAPKILQSDKGE